MFSPVLDRASARRHLTGPHRKRRGRLYRPWFEPCEQRILLAEGLLVNGPGVPSMLESVGANRAITTGPDELQEALQAVRRQQETTQWKAEYAARAGVEGTLSQGVRRFGLRRCRYIGLAKARLQHMATAAINVYRISDWLGGVPRAATRTSRFARLAA